MTAKELLIQLSVLTSKTIETAWKRNIQVGEDALTTYNLLTIDNYLKTSVLMDDTRGKEQEKGADWEFWIGDDERGWYRYAIQAKRITPSTGRYHKLNYKRGQQLDLLEAYAKANRAKPLYCFYNFTEHHGFKGRENELGCTITPLTNVKQVLSTRGKRNFEGIHNFRDTLPWYSLVALKENKHWESILMPQAYGPNHYHQILPAELESRRMKWKESIAGYHRTKSDQPNPLFSKSTDTRPENVALIDLGKDLS